MQYARVLIAIFILASNVVTGAFHASRPVTGSALAAVAAVGAATGAERSEGETETDEPVMIGVDYPSIVVNEVTIHAPNARRLAMGRTAVIALAERGFHVPQVDVYIHASRHGCASEPGNFRRSGVYIRRADGHVVHSCGLEFTLFHELAHVWEVAAMTDDQRDEFLEHRGLDYWSGPEWGLAGGEHAANVIAWAMLDGKVRPWQTLPNDDASLQEAYLLIESFVS